MVWRFEKTPFLRKRWVFCYQRVTTILGEEGSRDMEETSPNPIQAA
jgi:hypothetical protein